MYNDPERHWGKNNYETRQCCARCRPRPEDMRSDSGEPGTAQSAKPYYINIYIRARGSRRPAPFLRDHPSLQRPRGPISRRPMAAPTAPSPGGRDFYTPRPRGHSAEQRKEGTTYANETTQPRARPTPSGQVNTRAANRQPEDNKRRSLPGIGTLRPPARGSGGGPAAAPPQDCPCVLPMENA